MMFLLNYLLDIESNDLLNEIYNSNKYFKISETISKDIYL
jgi:hypothetical protein